MAEINWRDSWDSALEEAKKENRRVLLELYMDGCPHCTHLHTETHVDAGVIQAVNSKFIPVRLDGRKPHGHRQKIQRHRGAHHPGLRGRRQGTAPVSRLLFAAGLLETTGESRLIPGCAQKVSSALQGASYVPSMAA